MKIKLLFVSLLICMAGFSQDFILKKKLADSYYDQFDFYKALPMYEQLLKSHPGDQTLYEKLAAGYDHINDSENAERCYASLVQEKEVKPEYFLNYARALSRNGKYDQALTWYTKYGEVLPQDPRGAGYSEAYQNMGRFYRDSSAFNIVKAPFSSPADEFGPAWFGKSIVFSSDRPSFSMVRSTYNWTQSRFLDLYQANSDQGEIKPFSDDLNSPYHEGPVTFNKTRDTIIFTRSNYFHSSLDKSEDGVTKLGLFQANLDRERQKWTDIHPLTLNSKDYSVQHPALSPKGDKLYFASDLQGGMGGMDLYVSDRITDSSGKASWGVPVNLGPEINSPGEEVFPFMDEKGNLWYASNGIPGLGGLDIFLALKSKEGFSKTINPGYPLNTRFDDFGYITDATGLNGYFSSNRNNDYRDDDIYSFSWNPLKRVLLVYDTITGENIPVVHLKIIGQEDKEIVLVNQPAGPVILSLAPNTSYHFSASSGNYTPGIAAVNREQLLEKDTIKIALAKNPSHNPAAKVYREGEIIALKDIYYELNKSDILPEAARILDELLKILNDHSKIKIEMRSHTDSRASASYNLKLSDQRAKSAAAYLYSKGIAKDRIVGKGYGETKLINKCEDGIPCSEAEHQTNRRTEFKILKLN